MAPFLPPRAVVVLDLLRTDPAECVGQVVCSRTYEEGKSVVRHLHRGDDFYFLRAENPRVPIIELDFTILGDPIIGMMVFAYGV